jgi:hypothetical protein
MHWQKSPVPFRHPPFDLALGSRRYAQALSFLTPRFESSYDSLKAGNLVIQDVDLMPSAINVIDHKLHVAGFKSFEEMAETSEFVSGRRFVHTKSFTGPVLLGAP